MQSKFSIEIKQIGRKKSNMEIPSQFTVNYKSISIKQFKNKETWEMDS